MDLVTYHGLCECGCGQKAPVAQQTDTRLGWIKGQPLHFCRGHNRRGKSVAGYRKVGLRLLHRVRAERALGKPLPPRAVVHHADGTTNESAPLVICQNGSYHRLLHLRMRLLRAGGNPNSDKWCPKCERPVSKQQFYANTRASDGLSGYCKACTRRLVAARSRMESK